MQRTLHAILVAFIVTSLLFSGGTALADQISLPKEIVPNNYKIAKSVSSSFCEAKKDGLPIKEALDYAIGESKWSILAYYVLTPFIAEGESAEEETKKRYKDLDLLIEKMSEKCLSAREKREFSDYMQETEMG